MLRSSSDELAGLEARSTEVEGKWWGQNSLHKYYKFILNIYVHYYTVLV